MAEEVDPQLMIKASQLEKKSKEIETDLQFVDNQILELEEFSKNLDFLSKSKEKEVLASLTKGVYVKANLSDNDLLVDVGGGVIIKKTAAETRKIIEEQLKKLREARVQLAAQYEAYNQGLFEILSELEKAKK